jgi:hypothetical protein
VQVPWRWSRLWREPLAAWPRRALDLWPGRPRAGGGPEGARWPWPVVVPPGASPPEVAELRPRDLRGAWDAGRGRGAAWAALRGEPARFPVDPPPSAHEAAFRVVSATLAGRPAAELYSLADQVLRGRSRGTSARNHAVAERAALALAAAVVPGAPGAWRDAALELPALLEREVGPAGEGAEASFGYLVQDLEWGLLAWAVGVPGLEGALRRGASAASACLGADGWGPDLGDDDGGAVFPAASTHRDRVGAVLQALRAPPPPGYVPGLAAALLALPPPVAPAEPAPWTSASHTALRRGSHLVVVRHGALGAPPLFGHGHADALAVWWAPGGRWVVGSRGTGPYLGDPADRRFRRGSLAAATVVLDGRDHAEPHDAPFLWRRVVHAERVAADLGAGWVTGRVALDGAVVTRTVELGDDGALRLRDHLEGVGRRHVAVQLPLRPGAAAQVHADPRLVVTTRGDDHVPRYAARAPATTLVVEGVLVLPTVVETVLTASAAG